jgi:hypothetical protein
MEVVQWPDRVLFRMRKTTSCARCGWTDASRHRTNSASRVFRRECEGNALLVETTHFAFDITGFDDYNGIPSSQQKIVRERLA